VSYPDRRETEHESEKSGFQQNRASIPNRVQEKKRQKGSALGTEEEKKQLVHPNNRVVAWRWSVISHCYCCCACCAGRGKERDVFLGPFGESKSTSLRVSSSLGTSGFEIAGSCADDLWHTVCCVRLLLTRTSSERRHSRECAAPASICGRRS